MGYLEDFQVQLEKNDFHKFFQLWEEYCTSDTVDPHEFISLLKSIKKSEMAPTFGQYAETAIPLWQTIQDEKSSLDVFRLIIDLQTVQSDVLRETAIQLLEKHYPSDPDFAKRLRNVGLREAAGFKKDSDFQGSISHFELLAHLKPGNFIYHAGGWGTGEIIEVSPVREEIVVELENVTGRKYISFANAFKSLIPLQKDHFCVRRFAHPDDLEKEARENPVEVIKLLLRDMGPKTATEIKDELAELVIPEADWAKWWQNARAKVKKDTMIESPISLQKPFRLRKAAMSHEDLFQKQLSTKTEVKDILQAIYNFVRDLSDMLKKPDIKQSLQERLVDLLSDPSLTPPQSLQVQLFLENSFGYTVNNKPISETIQELKNIEQVINGFEIVALKKRALTTVRESRSDWIDLFLSFLFSLQQNQLRDYILKELQQPATLPLLEKKLRDLLLHPTTNPEVFVWYFQKVVEEEAVPFADKHGQCEFLETFLILYSILEGKPECRELIKKMYSILSGKRYLIVRNIIEGTSLEFIEEFLLLVSKCRTLSDHEKKILKSLAEVVHPSLTDKVKRKREDEPIWTTEAGLKRTQDRIKTLGTVEIIDVAREIEAARALGDLRENSEYKFALERRARLQTELKTLSDQLNRARIITPDDISHIEVGVGAKVDLVDSKGKKITYVILGPWDAEAEKNILSFQSKLAEYMIGKKVGDQFEFKDETFSISKVRSYLD